MTRRFPRARQVKIAGRMLLAALSMIVLHEAFAESPPKPAGATTNSLPPEIVLIQPVEFSAGTGASRTGAVQALQDATTRTNNPHGDAVEAAFRNLAARFPSIVTNLTARIEAQKRTVTGETRSVPSAAAEGKTFIEASMNPETFKEAGLDKLSRAELEILDRWLLNMSSELLATSRTATDSPQDKRTTTFPGKKHEAPLERVLLVKDFNGDRVLIQRSNGERWMLRAKTWCRWSRRYEGRYVSLLFGPITSELINEEGESLNFWIDRKID